MGIKVDRTGEKYINNQGLTMEVTQYVKAVRLEVIFEDGYKVWTRYKDLLLGTVRNPYFRSVYGVGFTGVGEHKTKIAGKMTKVYYVWSDMLKRCYSKNRENKTAYNGCTTSDDWLDFQKFGDWFNKNFKKDYALDKDILIKGNKKYSSETCAFVPREINNLLIKSNRIRGEHPIGVHNLKGRYNASCGIFGKQTHLGYFDTPEQAFQAYKKAKEQHIKEVADKWKDKIDTRVYEAMYKYEVNIAD